MSELPARNTPESAAHTEFNPDVRLDALQCGECTEDDFVREVLTQRESAPNLVWTVLARIDQRYRLGHLPVDLFRSVKEKIARHELEKRDDRRTIELHPEAESASPLTPHAVHREAAVADSTAAADYAQPQRDQEFSAFAAEPIKDLLQPTARNPPPGVCQVLRDRYVLKSVLGRGGMGTVFKALDRFRFDLPEKNRHVALKILDDTMGQRPKLIADLRREFYCAQALAHPNIVKVFEIHHDEDSAFYTMELLEGRLLSAALERAQPHGLDRRYAWAIIRDVGAALVHAHSRTVIHGDLKPQNIMVSDSGELRILDFGASGTSTRRWDTSDPLQRNRFPPVTLAYACCELLDGQETDPRDDLYALACLSYELLAGQHPFQGRRSTEARELGMRPGRPPGLTHRQWGALQIGLSWRRENRSLSVRNWLAMLGLESAPERLPPLHSAESMSTRLRMPVTLRPAVLIVALITVVSVWAALGNRRSETKSVAIPVTPAAQPRPLSGPAPTANLRTIEPHDGTLPAPPLETAPQPARQAVQVAPASNREQLTTVSGARDTPIAPPRFATATQISLSADTYRVHSDEHFVEINVWRSNESRGNSSFVWWTEAASARPGSDFVPQPRTTQLFLNGRHSAKLFVRILPNQTRTRTQMFYVRIATPSAGYSLGPMTRATVLVPPLTPGLESKPVYSAQRQP
jgi:serine/threonine protein kinase